jgi:hypothetical protein
VEIYRVRKSKIANNSTSYSLNLQKPTLFGLIASRSSQRVSTFNRKPQCIGMLMLGGGADEVDIFRLPLV